MKTDPPRSLLCILIAVLSVNCSTLFAQQPFTIGTVTAAPGQKTTGVIDVPAGVDAGTQIHVIVVRGAKPGPVLAIVSGAYGTEYASIIAVEKLAERLDPKELTGTVILLPLLNMASFQKKVPHLNPVDNKNMNRFYPGKPDGTQTERALYAMTREVVEKSDHLIDLHGGDIDESLRPYTYWAPVGKPQQDATSRGMAMAFGLDTIIISRDRPTDPAASRYLETTASLRGKPSSTAEAGYAGRVETDDVEKLITGCLGVMRYLKMLPGAPPMVEHPVWIERIDTVTSEQTGIFYPLVERGAYVAQGAKLGYVTDYTGKTIFEARAPAAGVVLYVCAVPSMGKGETIASVGIVAAGAPQ